MQKKYLTRDKKDPPLCTMKMLKRKSMANAATVLIMLAAAGIIVYSVMEMTKDKSPVGAARWYPPVMTTTTTPTTPTTPAVSRPMSTPTMLASKNGLGGGAFVGSQSLKVGGSTFKPGRNVLFDEFGFRNPQPWPLYKPPAPPAPEPVPMPSPALVDADAAALPTALVDADAAALPTAPVAPPSSMAPLGRRSAPTGSIVSRPRAPTQIMIDNREGYIVQPRA